jgi:hypothetical protein
LGELAELPLRAAGAVGNELRRLVSLGVLPQGAAPGFGLTVGSGTAHSTHADSTETTWGLAHSYWAESLSTSHAISSMASSSASSAQRAFEPRSRPVLPRERDAPIHVGLADLDQPVHPFDQRCVKVFIRHPPFAEVTPEQT